MAKMRLGIMGVMAGAGLGTSPAAAQEATKPEAPAEAATEASATSAPAYPPYAGPLVANAKPLTFDTPLGGVIVSGAVTGLAVFTSNPVPSDAETRADVSNAQVFVQVGTGPVQAVVQAGVYNITTLGYGYLNAIDTTDNLYGPVPVAYLKLAPSSDFSVIGGLIPTLIGAEYTFSLQNQNIARGLVWGQENAIVRGIQANYTRGKLALSVAVNDGFYSDKLNWLTGLLTFTLDSNNILAFAAGGNLDKTAPRGNLATPTAQNNGQIYNIIYTHKADGWTITPYLQYTRTHRLPEFGLERRGETFGGALLINKAFAGGLSFAGRGEYIKSYGRAGAPNLLGFGTGSEAWSITGTPGWQVGPLFIRADLSYTRLGNVEEGLGFGRNGEDKGQFRGLIEAGVLF